MTASLCDCGAPADVTLIDDDGSRVPACMACVDAGIAMALARQAFEALAAREPDVELRAMEIISVPARD